MICFRKSISTEWGRFVIEANEKGISRVIFPDDAASFMDSENESQLLNAAVAQFRNYCLGLSYDFRNLRYDFSEVSGFQQRVLITLLGLPLKTVSYSELAKLAGSPRAGRAVGNAMNQNPFPILIPCHRVVRADGDLGQYAWGRSWKELLLTHEKILPNSSARAFSESVLSDIIASV